MQIDTVFTEKNEFENRLNDFVLFTTGSGVRSFCHVKNSFRPLYNYILPYSTNNNLITPALLGRFRLSQSHCDAHEQGGQGETLGRDTGPHHVLRHLPIAVPEAPQTICEGSKGGKAT